MKSWKLQSILAGTLVVLAVVFAAAAPANADQAPGVLQLSPLETGVHIAVKIPVASDQAVSGLAWYNNDGNVAFPEILVVAGRHGRAPSLADAVILLEDVQGIESGWSHVDFGQDVMSPTGVFYAIFRLPGFEGEQGPGQGPGIGYGDIGIESSVFVGAEGDGWIRMVTNKRLLVDPVYAVNGAGEKSNGGANRPVLVLALPAAASGTDGELGPMPEEELPVRTEMLAPYPNPFNPQVTIAYALKESAEVKIAVYDMRGRRVREFIPGLKPAGRHQEIWFGQDDAGRRQASGVYFIRLSAGSYEQVTRVALLK